MAETKYIFKPDCGCHVGKVVGGTTYFLHVDHLGSLRQETDANGNAIWALPAVYEPFGELRGGGPANNEEGHLYTGKLRDTSTGLYYYGARYYDAKIGRFITEDTFPGRAGSPQTQNRYSYVLNNPMKYIDPSGNEAFDWTEFWEDVAAGLFTLNDYGWDMYGDMFADWLQEKTGNLNINDIKEVYIQAYYYQIGWENGYVGVSNNFPPTLAAKGALADLLVIPQKYKEWFFKGFDEGFSKGQTDVPAGKYDLSQCKLMEGVLNLLSDMMKYLMVHGFELPFEGTQAWAAVEILRTGVGVGEAQEKTKQIPWYCRLLHIGCP